MDLGKIYSQRALAKLYEALHEMSKEVLAEEDAEAIGNLAKVVGEIVNYYATTQQITTREEYAAYVIRLLIDKNGAEVLHGGHAPSFGYAQVQILALHRHALALTNASAHPVYNQMPPISSRYAPTRISQRLHNHNVSTCAV